MEADDGVSVTVTVAGSSPAPVSPDGATTPHARLAYTGAAVLLVLVLAVVLLAIGTYVLRRTQPSPSRGTS